MLRVGCYVRMTRERTNGFGPAAQKDEVLRWAEYTRAEVVVVPKFDRLSRSMRGFVDVLEASQRGG